MRTRGRLLCVALNHSVLFVTVFFSWGSYFGCGVWGRGRGRSWAKQGLWAGQERGRDMGRGSGRGYELGIGFLGLDGVVDWTQIMG